MERQVFERIVTEMEAMNARDPQAYRRKVESFANLGFAVYAGVFLLLLVLLAIVVALLVSGQLSSGGARLLIIVGFLVFAFSRAVLIKVPAPQNRVLQPHEAPELMRELERIRTKIGAPPIHEVQLDYDFNAYASSATRFAVFGERCYVVLGLPLLLTQTKDEVIATLGHELAHHSKSHVRSGTRAYRLEAMWQRVLYQLNDAGSLFVWPLLWFFKWYSPRFSAMSLVVRRQAEYEADAVGADATNKKAMAYGLIRMGVDGPTVLSPYYDRLESYAIESPVPPSNFLQGFQARTETDESDRRKALVRTLKSETVYEDSHPSVRSRTEALGIPADPDDPETVDRILSELGTVERSAAEELFGDALPGILQELDKAWAEDVKEYWKQKHESYEDSRKTLERLDGKALEDLDEKEAIEWLQASGHIKGVKNVKEEALALAARHPENGRLQFLAGYTLIECDQDEGVAMLERAAELDSSLRGSVLESIADFRAARGESHAARQAAVQAADVREQQSERYELLATVNKNDTLEPFQGDEETLTRVVQALPNVKRAKAAYAFRKTDPERPEFYLDVVVVIVARPSIITSEEEFLNEQSQLAYKAIGPTKGAYCYVHHHASTTAKVLAKSPHLQIYKAD